MAESSLDSAERIVLQSCVHADVISQILDPTLVDPYTYKGREYICLAAAALIQWRVQVMQSFAVTFGSSGPCAQKMPETVLDLMRYF